MKYGLLVLSMFAVCVMVGLASAEENAAMAPAAVEVGNKICPMSGEEVGKMGPAHTVEYNGKVYNLCCAMCEKDFLKDPEATIKKIEAGMAEGAAQPAAPATK